VEPYFLPTTCLQHF